MPKGRHIVKCVSTELKEAKGGGNGYLQLDLANQSGQQIALRLNLFHANPVVVGIANKQFSSVCHATGVMVVQDSNQLLNIPFAVDVRPQKDDPKYTEVFRILRADGGDPATGKFVELPIFKEEVAQAGSGILAAAASVAATATAAAAAPTAGWGAAAEVVSETQVQSPAVAAAIAAAVESTVTAAPAWGASAAPAWGASDATVTQF